jgi:hypothetical protein
LDEVLRHIKHAKQPQTLWIDQICINQADKTGEKGPQVQLMAKIYSGAERVLAWLGPADATSDELLDKLSHVEKRAYEIGFGFPDNTVEFGHVLQRFTAALTLNQRSVQVMAMKPGQFHSRTLSPELFAALCREAWVQSAGSADAIRQFLSAGWFSRVWIVQEAALARKLVFPQEMKRLDPYYFTAVWKYRKSVQAMPSTGTKRLRSWNEITRPLTTRRSRL